MIYKFDEFMLNENKKYVKISTETLINPSNIDYINKLKKEIENNFKDIYDMKNTLKDKYYSAMKEREEIEKQALENNIQLDHLKDAVIKEEKIKKEYFDFDVNIIKMNITNKKMHELGYKADESSEINKYYVIEVENQ